MSILWGSYVSHMRCGIDVSFVPSTITKDTSSVTVTWKMYAQNDSWGFEDPQTMNYSNAISGSDNYTMSVPSGQVDTVLTGTHSHSVSTSYSGSVSRTLDAYISGIYLGGNPSRSRTVTIPRRPPQLPSAPTSATVTRVSDTQHTIDWTAPADWDSTDAYWDTIYIRRWDSDSGSWSTVATLTNQGRRTWTDNSTEANLRYRYAVKAANESGSSAYAYTDFIQTTPAAPTNLVATKSGSDIVLTWHDENPNNTTTWDIDDNPDGTGWTNVATGVAESGTLDETWTDVAPNASVTHTYRVRAVTTYNTPDLDGDWSASSNTVQLLAAPDAPTNLDPDSETVDAATDPILLTWQHNPTDTTAQTAYDVGYSINGGTWTYTGQTTSTDSEYDITSLVSTGDTVDWKVRTWGDYSSPSDYSATASFDVYSAPTATIQSPSDTDTLTTSSHTVTWTYYQAESHAQAGWQARIIDTSDSTTIATSSGSTETQWATGNVLEDGANYDIEVRVRSVDGLWSAWDSVNVDISYAPPLAPLLTLSFDVEYGRVVIEVAGQDNGSDPDTVDLFVERLESDGSWTLIAEDLGVDATLYDYECPVADTALTYRATSISATPSTNTTSDTVDTTPTTSGGRTVGVYVSGGPDFATVCPLAYKVTFELEGGRERVLRTYSGDESPTETSGYHVPKSIAVTAVVLRDALEEWETTRESLEALAELPGPHLYRDCTGRKMWCSLSPVKEVYARAGEVSFTATRANTGTQAQLDAVAASVTEQ